MYMLEGWEDSVGAPAERGIAKWLGIPVYYQNARCPKGALPLAGGFDNENDDPLGMPSQQRDRTTQTGAKRDDRSGKGRFDLIPPEALQALAERLEVGAKHYGERNWEKGQPLSWFVDSGMRHLM